MEHVPLVSVIVPVYNMEQSVGKILESVLASDYPSFEVIVMDDGSTDASLSIAEAYARKDSRVKVYSQPNAGTCATRNHAIALSEGELIFPVDADNMVTPDFIRKAVDQIIQDNPFSLQLLARKNIIGTCALYRKSDWEWAGGPPRYRRMWSKWINRCYRVLHPRKVFVSEAYAGFSSFVKLLPVYFKQDEGQVIYKGRNELREFRHDGIEVVVKSFCKPNWINRVVYGWFRSSKAQRSYEYAEMLLKSGIETPRPVGYYTERNGLLFSRSYYVCLKSECPYTYYDLVKSDFPNQKRILRAIARTTGAMHEQGYLHKDYSRGNILFQETEAGVKVEVIDLNRIRFMRIGMETGCKNFERLPATDEMLSVMADEYAKVRGFNPKECFRLMKKYRE